MAKWIVEHQEPKVPIVRIKLNGAADEFWLLMRSDAHWDNPDSNRRLMKHHLDQAIERNAGIIDGGDLFCAMQGKYDKRSDKSKIRTEHQSGDYLDKLVKTAIEFHLPYAKNWVGQWLGNHDTAIAKNHETCLITRLAEGLREKTGAIFPVVGYSGWVRLQFSVSTRDYSVNIWGIHGYGGGGPVTKDMIQRHRQLAYIDNADIMFSGHTHDEWKTTDIRITLKDSGHVAHRPATYLKLPTYKDEYKDGKGGFPIEKGHPPKPIGAKWVRFYAHKQGLKWEVRDAIEQGAE